MICTICGCQQRKADVCMQCHSPLLAKEVQGNDPFGGLREDDTVEYEEIDTNPSILEDVAETTPTPNPAQVGMPVPEAEAKTKSPETLSETQKEQDAISEVPEPTPVKNAPTSKAKSGVSSPKGAQTKTVQNILITTTQRVEGKRISTYYGLVHAEALIVFPEGVSGESQPNRRKKFNGTVSEVLQTLRQEAILFKANAIVATSFNHQVINPKTILLSAMGTAVLLKEG